MSGRKVTRVQANTRSAGIQEYETRDIVPRLLSDDFEFVFALKLLTVMVVEYVDGLNSLVETVPIVPDVVELRPEEYECCEAHDAVTGEKSLPILSMQEERDGKVDQEGRR